MEAKLLRISWQDVKDLKGVIVREEVVRVKKIINRVESL